MSFHRDHLEITVYLEQGLYLTGPDGVLKQLTKAVLETALTRNDRSPRL